ncbi:MAG: hypothetical protein ABFC84_18955 [Veillonellales bacterium]
MNVYNDPAHEIVYHILGLLPTIEAALTHMVGQLDELRLEESEVLFRDAAQAIGSIAENVAALTGQQENADLLKTTARMRRALGAVIDGFESGSLPAIQNALVQQLLPAFLDWRRQIEQLLLPAVVV